MRAASGAVRLLSLTAGWSAMRSAGAWTTAPHRAQRHCLPTARAFSPPAPAATARREGGGGAAPAAAAADATFWNARQDCWRPDVRDVERISFGQPAKKKRTGSRGVPHRLNDDERRTFDRARKQGFLQVNGSAWRSERRDAPLLNTYRSWMDARGRPMVVLHKRSPGPSGAADDDGDRLVVDLSPLRTPDEFERVGRALEERMSSEFGVESLASESVRDDAVDADDDDGAEMLESRDDDDDWETRPIYQLPPHVTSWKVGRSQGKQMGKFLGCLFDNVEANAAKSKKPRGVKPGKGRRHGGYGIG